MSLPDSSPQQIIEDNEVNMETSDTSTDTEHQNAISPSSVPLNLSTPEQDASMDCSTIELDNSDDTNPAYQESPDDDESCNLGLGGKLVSAKNSLELMPRKEPTRHPDIKHATVLPVELEPEVGLELIEEDEYSKSVIQNLTNANIKANGHHVVWADTLDNPSEPANQEANTKMTISTNKVFPAGNNGRCQQQIVNSNVEMHPACPTFNNPPPPANNFTNPSEANNQCRLYNGFCPDTGNVTEILYNSNNLYYNQEGVMDLSRHDKLEMVASLHRHSMNSIGELYRSDASRGNYQEELGSNPMNVAEIPRSMILNPSETCENLFEKLNGSDVQLNRSDHENHQKVVTADCFESGKNNVLVKPKNVHVTTFDEDDEFIPDEKPSALNLSVDYARTPDPLFIAKCIDPAYHALINQKFKKDCRTWLYKNRSARAKVLAKHHEVQEQNASKKIG